MPGGAWRGPGCVCRNPETRDYGPGMVLLPPGGPGQPAGGAGALPAHGGDRAGGGARLIRRGHHRSSDRFRRTRVPDPTGTVGGGASPAGRRSRPTAPTRTAGAQPGLLRQHLAGVRESWATSGPGVRPSTSAPSSRPRRTTATAPGTMRRSTPCWAQGRLPRPAPTPTPWACGWCWTACSTTGLCQPLFQRRRLLP